MSKADQFFGNFFKLGIPVNAHNIYKQLLIGLKLQNDSFPVDQSELLLFHFKIWAKNHYNHQLKSADKKI
jgi:hypothetical protein